MLDYTQSASTTGWKILSRYAGGNLQFVPNKNDAGYNNYSLSLDGTTGTATFSNDVVLNNGKFLQAVRNTGSALIDIIGIQSGTDTLQIKGGTSGGSNSINFYDTGGLIATFYNSNLGIGVTSPTYKLDVNGNARVVAGLQISNQESSLYASNGALSYYSPTNGVYLNGAGTNGWLRLNAAGTENYVNCIDIYGTAVGGFIRLRTGGETRMHITNGGFVGIGTDDPSQKLHVNGFARLQGYQVWGTGDTISAFVGYEKAWTGTGSSNNLAISAEGGNGISFLQMEAPAIECLLILLEI